MPMVRPRHSAMQPGGRWGFFLRKTGRGDGLTMNVTIPANTTALIHIPVIDKPWSTITESGRALINNEGQVNIPAGLRFVNKNNKSVIFEAGSGEYEFTAM